MSDPRRPCRPRTQGHALAPPLLAALLLVGAVACRPGDGATDAAEGPAPRITTEHPVPAPGAVEAFTETSGEARGAAPTPATEPTEPTAEATPATETAGEQGEVDADVPEASREPPDG